MEILVLSGCVLGVVGLMSLAWWLDGRAYEKAVSAAWDRHLATVPEPADLAPDTVVRMGPAALAVLIAEGPWHAYEAVVAGLAAKGSVRPGLDYRDRATLLRQWEKAPPEEDVEKAIRDQYLDLADLHPSVVIRPVMQRLVSEGVLREGETSHVPFRPPVPLWARTAGVLGLVLAWPVAHLFPDGPYLGRGPVLAAAAVIVLSLLMFINAHMERPAALRLPRLSERGEQVVEQARAQFAHLDPAVRDESQRYEPDEVAFAVALFGDRALAHFSEDLVERFAGWRAHWGELAERARREEYLRSWSG
ncbi:TIGR04222 domain-containing membrane protein [Streptomyces sp. NPDC017435]|uniref:TIGR04222 domain-containing membrane protein n=1 Tax=Streptomyces sp. NPDC017435 TaxID=3364995 RepID=UPI0037AE0AE8